MDDTQRIVKCGSLSLHSPGGFFKKRWHSKYLVLYDGSKSGVKRLELFDSEIKFKKQNPAKIIPLVDCVRVVTCQRHKTTFTFEVRTNDQFYLLASQSFQDMNDWVNCIRLVAFGQASSLAQGPATPVANERPAGGQLAAASQVGGAKRPNSSAGAGTGAGAGAAATTASRQVDVLLDRRLQLDQRQPVALALAGRTGAAQTSPAPRPAPGADARLQHSSATIGQAPAPPSPAAGALGAPPAITTASQAAAAAASALAKTRQRQPSLLGSCKPQPPTDSPFIQQTSGCLAPAGSGSALGAILGAVGQLGTLTPAVRGQLIAAGAGAAKPAAAAAHHHRHQAGPLAAPACLHAKPLKIQTTLDEEEENMLYCSIEDNPSEHNYRVKVIETELSLRCQLKCYQLTAPSTISQQYEELAHFRAASSCAPHEPAPAVTFYQLIIGPQELTLLNDYAAYTSKHQLQGLWSWPYQCIRRYGFDKDNCFMFEAGRKCTSGPGQFIVQTPKAYQIYQDVVKFVNELRTIGGAPDGGGPPNLAPGATSGRQPHGTGPTTGAKQNPAVVTQIPVVWAPSEQQHSVTSVPDGAHWERQARQAAAAAVASEPQDSVESRRHFFDTLRQLDSSSSLSNNHGDNQQLSGHSAPASDIQTRHQQQIAPTSSDKRPSGSTIKSMTSHDTTTTTVSKNGCSPSRLVLASSCSDNQFRSAAGEHPVQINQLVNREQPGGADNKSDRLAASIASDETDESGYEQGDESVDSGAGSAPATRHAKSLPDASATGRKRQANDSMSSASSTTSSSGGPSPGQSVSRRSAGALGNSTGSLANGQGPAKRPPINDLRQRAKNNTGQHDGTKQVAPIGLCDLIADGRPGEFEANLIRDVYSEITKLHAKFAVTSNGSAEDSMSSNSSSQESADNMTKEEEEEAEDQMVGDETLGEPMYSNVEAPDNNDNDTGTRDFVDNDHVYERDKRQVHRANVLADKPTTDGRRQSQSHRQPPTSRLQQQQQQPHDNGLSGQQFNHHQRQQQSYTNNNNNFDFLSQLRPMYPTILNPIPECGELAQPAPATPKAPKLHDNVIITTTTATTHANVLKPSNHSVASNTDKGLPRARLASNRDDVKKPTNNNQQSATDRLKPTNHYVINDVQYAKISRNIHSKFESCL